MRNELDDLINSIKQMAKKIQEKLKCNYQQHNILLSIVLLIDRWYDLWGVQILS